MQIVDVRTNTCRAIHVSWSLPKVRSHLLQIDPTYTYTSGTIIQAPSHRKAPNHTMERDYKHPERHIEGMVFFPKKQLPSERSKSQVDILNQVKCKIVSAEDLETELCRSCGWNVKHECHSSYVSRLRVMHTKDNKGMWSLVCSFHMQTHPAGVLSDTSICIIEVVESVLIAILSLI